ncbi:MAG: NAD(P)H-dependent oxidoreductase [Alphaproteobacteria bacterium]
MNVLVVFAHPKRDSFSGALLDSFVAGLAESGHEATVADLYREGFDPRFGDDDLAHFNGHGPAPEEVRAEQRRLEQADALVFIFPVWWWSFPAMLKGWIDRVFTGGWAYDYDYTNDKSIGLLKDRPVLMIASASAGVSTYKKYGFDSAIRAQIDTGTMAFCGLEKMSIHLLHDVAEDRTITEAHIATSQALGRDFPPGENN